MQAQLFFYARIPLIELNISFSATKKNEEASLVHSSECIHLLAAYSRLTVASLILSPARFFQCSLFTQEAIARPTKFAFSDIDLLEEGDPSAALTAFLL